MSEQVQAQTKMLPPIKDQLVLNHFVPIKKEDLLNYFADTVTSVDGDEFISFHTIPLKGAETAYVVAIETPHGPKAELVIIIEHAISDEVKTRRVAFISRLSSPDLLID